MNMRFIEYVYTQDGAVTPDAPSDLLQKLVQDHGGRFRALLKDVIVSGQVDDDPEFLEDLKQLRRALGNISSDQFPVRNRKQGEPDIVTRPKADGAGGMEDQGGE